MPVNILPLRSSASLLLALLMMMIAAASCDTSDDFSDDPSLRLRFSADTLRMDTVLTDPPTPTYTLKVYNPHPRKLLLSSVSLADGEKSGFRINLDGIPGTRFTDVELAAEDSLYLFVEGTFPAHGDDLVTLVRDSVVFELNGIRQEMKLWAYTQDAVVLRRHVLARDTLIASARPLLIYDSLVIAAGTNVTLAAGTRLFFHDKATLEVHGRLLAEGTIDHPVLFRGDRTDRIFPYLPYDRLPGQWGGIRFHIESLENRLTCVDVHGGQFGIRCDSTGTAQRKLTLQNSLIRQIAGTALELTACQALITNSEISNAGTHCVALWGGDYTFVHCSLANFFSWDIRKGVTLLLGNRLEAAIFRNCLIEGSGTDEISVSRDQDADAPFNYYFSHCLINSIAEENDHIVGVVWKRDDAFRLLDVRTQQYDFTPTEGSAAIDLGRPEDALAYPLDRRGNSRLADTAPDAGCYEAEKKRTD
ncbi:MAG: hypothetical protein LBM06_04215 [Prevotellaceae bacterium]|jgi:hypothetical protein|nr:hypothetical protein [Prevotellaceae bacterium]